MSSSEPRTLRNLILVALFIALGVVLSPMLVIPLGFAKAFPVQHMLNVFIAVFFGVYYNVGASFTLSTIRNIIGTGSILAYPGSMIGAFLSAWLYRQTGKVWAACLGEVIGTGLIGGYVAYLVSAYVLGSRAGALAMIVPFLASSAIGAALAGIVIALVPEGLKAALQGSSHHN